MPRGLESVSGHATPLGPAERDRIAVEQMLLAELVVPQQAVEAVRKYSAKKTPNGLLDSAWNHAEYAMNQRIGVDRVVRECYFDYTDDLTGRIINQHRGSETTLLGALVLSSYLPLLKKRSFGETISSTDCQNVYDSLGHALGYMQPLNSDDPPLWYQTEVTMLAASARMKQPHLLMYPSSPREEAAKYHQTNHDSYFVAGRTKYPVQQKLIPVDREYDQQVTMLFFEDVLDHAFRKTAQLAPAESADRLNHVVSLIVAETHGELLPKSDRSFMNCVSRAVAYHYHTARQNAA